VIAREQSGRGHVQRSWKAQESQVGEGHESGVGGLQSEHVVATQTGGDRAGGGLLGHGIRGRRYAVGARAQTRRVDDHFIGGKVRSEVVERVGVPAGRQQRDQHGDEDGKADRGQRRTGAGAVPAEVAQRDPHADRRASGEPAEQGDADRCEQQHPGRGGEQTTDLEQRIATASRTPPTRVSDEQEPDGEQDGSWDHRTAGRARISRAARQRGHDRQPGCLPGGLAQQ
jgi:hypothetical protein